MNYLMDINVRIKIFDGFWTVDDVRNNRDSLFIFGDNDIHLGNKGQAVIRGEINTAGIPTKKTPQSNSYAFYSDDDYDTNCANITKAITDIKKKLAIKKYKFLVLPSNGLGTGLAKLPEKAPKTYEFLGKSIRDLVNSVSHTVKIKTATKNNKTKTKSKKVEHN